MEEMETKTEGAERVLERELDSLSVMYGISIIDATPLALPFVPGDPGAEALVSSST